MDLQALLPLLMPRAIAWAEAVAADAMARGETLSPSASDDAKTVGVCRPDKVRVLTVDHLPLPEHPELRAAAFQTGLLVTNMIGLTLGYAILICSGHMSRSLLSHECRHVAQYEQAGSIASFLPDYLSSIVEVGYENSPFEREACAYELSDAGLNSLANAP
jgi:hypothetical protein